MKNKDFPIIADYVPVLQTILQNYHNGNFKSQKKAMELMEDIGNYLNIQTGFINDQSKKN
jgi:hypothetical protein